MFYDLNIYLIDPIMQKAHIRSAIEGIIFNTIIIFLRWVCRNCI